MLSKDKAAEMMHSLGMPQELAERSREFSLVGDMDVEQVKGAISAINSNQYLKKISADKLALLESNMKRVEDFGKGEILSVWGFAEVKRDSVNLLLPVKHSGSYSGLIKSLFDHSLKIMGRIGDPDVSAYKDLLHIGANNGELAPGIKHVLIEELMQAPAEFEQARIVYGLNVTYWPAGYAPKRRRTAASGHGVGRSGYNRGDRVKSVLGYVNSHPEGADFKEFAAAEGCTAGAAYQAFNTLRTKKLLDRRKDGKYVRLEEPARIEKPAAENLLAELPEKPKKTREEILFETIGYLIDSGGTAERSAVLKGYDNVEQVSSHIRSARTDKLVDYQGNTGPISVTKKGRDWYGRNYEKFARRAS